MRKIAIILAAAAAAIASPAYAGEPDHVYSSRNDPEQIAACLDRSLNGKTKVTRSFPGTVEVARKNGFGMTMVKWVLRRDAEGSTIELYDKLGINSGKDKAEACFKRAY